MKNSNKYRLLCDIEKTIPVFSRDWWLDITCGEDNWDAFIIEEKGHILAAMPFYSPLQGLVTMPHYTQTMGPWFASIADDTKYSSAIAYKQSLAKTFAEAFRKHTFFLQNFSYHITDWLPFYWEGFKQTTRYTYLLKEIADTEKLWSDMSGHTRRNIQKAKEKYQLVARKGIPADDFLQVLDKTFQRQGITSKQDPQVLTRLIETCRQREQGDTWGCYDENGNLHAVVFVVWQESSAYYLAGGGDPAFRDSGAHSLAMWEAIQYVSDKSEIFDFEGSMLPGVERFFREFGAVQTPYFTISKGKMSLISRALLKYKRMHGR